MPPPPDSHAASPARGGSGSPYRSTATTVGYGSPGAAAHSYVASSSPPLATTSAAFVGADAERAKEEDRHRKIAEFLHQTVPTQGGSPAGSYPGSPARYAAAAPASPLPLSSRPLVGVPPAAPVYISGSASPPLQPAMHVAYSSPRPAYAASPAYASPAGSPPPPLTGAASEGESPRRIRAWGASGSLR